MILLLQVSVVNKGKSSGWLYNRYAVIVIKYKCWVKYILKCLEIGKSFVCVQMYCDTLHIQMHTKICQKYPFFLIFCWPCISLQILANDQLDTFFYVFIYFVSLHVSSITMHIIGRSNCINTSSGMISLCKWLLGMPSWPAYQAVTQTNHIRWCINAIWSPDDVHCDARNM